jgi:DNA repair exonuclease SbcCD nuclease subunit
MIPTPPRWSGNGDGAQGEVTSAVLPVRGLGSALRVLHISDSHVNVEPGATSQFTDVLDTAFRLATEQNVALVVHTGDCVQTASAPTVKFVQRTVADAGLPFFYISGNADWMDPTAVEKDSEEEATHVEKSTTREYWRGSVLVPLFGGATPSHWVRDVKGGQLRFVGVDNSTGQVDSAQLRAVQKVERQGVPFVLMVHIPLWNESIKAAIPGQGSLCGDPDDPTSSATTRQFAMLMSQSAHVVCVLAGHIHRAEGHWLQKGGGHGVLLTTAATKDGGSRLLDFVPATADARL